MKALETLTSAERITMLNQHKPGFLNLLGGHIVSLDSEQGTCTFEFKVPLEYCHSGNIVQGGFVTAMLDAAMAHAVFGCHPSIARLSSMEISTRYEDATRGEEKLTVIGRIRKLTRSIAFLDGEIFNQQGHICATAHSVAKISRDNLSTT